jgi:hypothetical protein
MKMRFPVDQGPSIHPQPGWLSGTTSLAVGAAEHGDHAGIELAEPAQQRQGRDVLLERGRAADHAGAGREHPARGAVDELALMIEYEFDYRV